MKKDRLLQILEVFRNYFRNHFLYRRDLTSDQKYCSFFEMVQRLPEFNEVKAEFKFSKLRSMMEKIVNKEFEENSMEKIKFWEEKN